MNELQIFTNKEFGEVRVVLINNKPYAVARDVAMALGYVRPHEAVQAHCRGAVSYRIIDFLGREQEVKNKLDYIDKVLNKIPELYEIACKLYESDVQELIDELYKISN